MLRILYVILFTLFSSTAFAGTVGLEDEGSPQGYPYKLDCQGAGISCSRSGGTGIINVTGVAQGSGVPLEVQNDGVALDTNAILLDFDRGLTATEPSGQQIKIVFDETENYTFTGQTTFDVSIDGDLVGNVTGDLTGNSDTATALAANGSNCSALSYALGVDASGVAEGCTDASTEIDSIVATHTADGDAHHAESHTIVSHSDTSATGAELNELTDSSETTLHSHASSGSSVGGQWSRDEESIYPTSLDTTNVYVGGTSNSTTYDHAFLANGQVIINEQGSNVIPFRVENSVGSNMIYVDNNVHTVGINTGSPDTYMTGNTAGIVIVQDTTDKSNPAQIALVRPSTSLVDDSMIGGINFLAGSGAGTSVINILGRVNGTSENSGELQFNLTNAGSGATRMVIKPDGDVGIGQNDPTQKLEVVGNILSDGLMVGANENLTMGSETLDHDGTTFVFSDDATVTDEAYGAGWNGSLEIPTKNAVYDKMETVGGGGGTPSGIDFDVQLGIGGSFTVAPSGGLSLTTVGSGNFLVSYNTTIEGDLSIGTAGLFDVDLDGGFVSIVSTDVDSAAFTVEGASTNTAVMTVSGSGTFTGWWMETTAYDPCTAAGTGEAEAGCLFRSPNGRFCQCDNAGIDREINSVTSDCTYTN